MVCLCFRLFKSLRHTKLHTAKKKVLIVKLDAIGDYILWLDAAKELRRVYPANEHVITLLGNKQWIELAKSHSCFDVVWSIDRPTFFVCPANYSELLRKLGNESFDIVLHPVYSREFLFGDLFVWASSAQRKIGMLGDGSNLAWWQKRLGDRIYTDLVSGAGAHESELENNACLVRWLGLTDFKAGIPDLEVSPEWHSISLPANYFVIIVGASVRLKVWPISRFVALVERVLSLTGMTVVVCGGRAEQHLGTSLKKCTSAPLVDLTGQTTLPELVAVISNATFVVGNDTGAIHIASALGVPSVCIVGGGHFGRFVPYNKDVVTHKHFPVPVFKQMECFGCNWHCIYDESFGKAARCIEAVTVEAVYTAVLSIYHDIKVTEETLSKK